MGGVQEILERKQAELVRVLRKRDGIAMEKSAAIGPKRVEAVPWASRCIQCQEGADRDGQERTDLVSETLVNAA